MLSPRIRLKPLAQLCYRLATTTRAGIEDRKIWRDEAQRGSRTQRAKVALIRDEIARGMSLTEALRATGNFYPPLFRQMLEVGETSGQLARTYTQLAEHYNHTLAVRRDFLGRLAWPMMQLGMALGIIGLLIWIMGILPINTGSKGPQVDMLGWGLIGTRGLIIYVNVLVVIAMGILLAIEAARRGVVWTRPLQRLALRIPVVGGALKTLALSRFIWALKLVFDTPMDLRRALPLALEATGNDYYARFGPEVAQRIEAGQDIHSTLSTTGIFPTDLLDHIAVGEESGRLVETMEHQSAEYQERAATALSVLAQIAGYAIWLLIAGFIIMMIFRVFGFYNQQLNSLM